MEKDLHNNDDQLFKSAYQEFEEKPSTNAWDKINAELDKIEANDTKKKYYFWKTAAIILGFLLAGLYTFELLNSKKEKISYFKKEKSKNNEKVNSEIIRSKQEKSSLETKIINKENEEIIEAKNELLTLKNLNEITEKKFIAEKYQNNRNALLKANRKINLAIPLNQNLFSKKENIEKDIKNLLNKKTERLIEDFDKNSVLNKSNFYHIHTESQSLLDSVISHNSASNTSNLSITTIDATNLNPLVDSNLLETDSIYTSIVLNSFDDSLPKQKNRNTWLFTNYVSYDWVKNKLDSDLPTNIKTIKNREVHEPSFSIGFNANKNIIKNWGLQTGVIYSITSIGILPQKLFAQKSQFGDAAFKYTTSSGFAYVVPGLGGATIIGDSLNFLEGKHTIHYLRIPLVLTYTFSKKNILISPGIGIENNFTTSAKIETEIEHPNRPEMVFINKLEGTKSFHFTGVAHINFRFRINNKLSGNIIPLVRFALSPITQNNLVETFPNNRAIGLGISYKF